MKFIKKMSYAESISKYLVKNASLDEMRTIATRICRDYLTGSWKTITSEQIVLKRISGGLSNFLYYVSLPDVCDNNANNHSSTDQLVMSATKRIRTDSGQNCNEPKEVLLRIYGQTHGEHALETMVTESVVFTLLSERNLGPKLHGIFPGGRIEQYIPARPLNTTELSDYKMSMKIAEKMAAIHSLDIPVSKEPDWLWKSMDRWLKSAMTNLEQSETSEGNETLKSQINEIRQTNLQEEVNWLKSLIHSADFPVVFCHNDLQEGNILFSEERVPSARSSMDSLSTAFEDSAIGMENSALFSRDNSFQPAYRINDLNRKRSLPSDPNLNCETDTRDSVLSGNSEDCDPDLIIIDYEYCAYNYRGFDLANHFIEWTCDYTNTEFPYFYHNKHNYPTVQQRRDFIGTYLRHLHQADENYQPTEEEVAAVEREVSVFSLVSHLFWSLWSIVNVHQNIEFGYWDYALARLREYHAQKKRMQQQLH